jgi:putative tryptophan/tyrosine transport system substrate-binding protein
MRRREVIEIIGGLAVWPIAGRAQPASSDQQITPVTVGFLHGGSIVDSADHSEAFLQGLKQHGYAVGQNINVEFRWAEGRYERLRTFADEFVRTQVALIAAGGPPATAAAKSATSTIPIVFITADPVREGIVASLNRPGGNATGIGMSVIGTAEMWGKRLELLHYLIPNATSFAVLVNPPDASNPDPLELVRAARTIGIELRILTAASDSEIEATFASAQERKLDGLLVSDLPFFTVRHRQIAGLASQYDLPTMYGWRQYVVSGGLMSYGSDLAEAWHQIGDYAGRVLKGARPSELPVIQPARFKFILNAKAARTLGLTIPDTVLTLADEVIE